MASRTFLAYSLRQRFRCVAFDYPGMGLSSGDPAFDYRVAALTDVAERVVEASTCVRSP